MAVATYNADLDLFVSTTDAKGWPLAQTPTPAVLQIRPVPQATGALTDHVCPFNLVPTSSPVRAAANAPLAHHAEAVTVVRPSSRPTLITVVWEPTPRTAPTVNSVFLDNAFHSTLLQGHLLIAALMENANQDLTARIMSAYLSRSQPTYRNAEAAQNPAEATRCASRTNVSATWSINPTLLGSHVVLGLEVPEHVFPVQMRMEIHSRVMEAVPLEEAAALATVSRMAMAREIMPTAKKEDLLMEMDHRAKTMMHPVMEMHNRQMVPTMETPLAMGAHRKETTQPQLGQREPQAMLGAGEMTQLLAQETGMDKQTKMDPIKMALTEHHRTRMEEILAPGHQLQLATQPVLAILSVSTTNALQFRTRHPAVPRPAVSCVFCGDKRHQPASQALLVLTTSAYRPMARSTAAHQVSIAPSTTLVSKIPAWLLVIQLHAVAKLAAVMKFASATSARQVPV